MRVTDENDDETGEYDFPVTLYKGESEYAVPNLESMQYHIIQGWSLDKPEPVEHVEPPVLLTASSLDELRAEVADLRKAVAELHVALPSLDMIKGQGQLLARLQGEVSRVGKLAGVGKPPAAPPAPPA